MNPRLMAAIMTGCLSHREARVMLAVASGAWSAGSAARATGLDRAHCTRALRSLVSAGWLRRDETGRVISVDNPPAPVPEEHHLLVPQEHQGGADSASPPVPQEHHPDAENAHGGAPLLRRKHLENDDHRERLHHPAAAP